MNDLAIAYVTCDKYAHVWNEWMTAFTNYWNYPASTYWLGESKSIGDFIEIIINT